MKFCVLEKVPANNPSIWCSRMGVLAKRDGRPRRVVDLRSLNEYTIRQTHPTESPFVQASKIPSRTFKTTTNAWNGYHSVPLGEEECHLTTFINPWGCY